MRSALVLSLVGTLSIALADTGSVPYAVPTPGNVGPNAVPGPNNAAAVVGSAVAGAAGGVAAAAATTATPVAAPSTPPSAPEAAASTPGQVQAAATVPGASNVQTTPAPAAPTCNLVTDPLGKKGLCPNLAIGGWCHCAGRGSYLTLNGPDICGYTSLSKPASIVLTSSNCQAPSGGLQPAGAAATGAPAAPAGESVVPLAGSGQIEIPAAVPTPTPNQLGNSFRFGRRRMSGYVR